MDKETYEEWVELHEQQKRATDEREKRAQRRLDLLKSGEENIEVRERAKQLEWEAQMLEREKKLKKNATLLDRKKKEMEMLQMEEEQALEFESINQEMQDRKARKHAKQMAQKPNDYLHYRHERE